MFTETKFEGNRPANSAQKDLSFTSFPFTNKTRSESKPATSPFNLSQTVQREDDGAVQFWKIKNYLRNQFPQVQHRSDDRWKACLAAGGGAKRRYQYCTDGSGIIVYFRALQGHSGRNLIDPSLQDNVIIQRGFFQHFYHIGCAFNLQQWIDTWRSEFKQETYSILLAY